MLKRALRLPPPSEDVSLDLVFVDSPTLDGLVVEVGEATMLDEDSLLELWGRVVADESPRTQHNTVGKGHLVEVAVIGFRDGVFVPYTAAEAVVVMAGDDQELPDLGDALIGQKVGNRFKADGIRVPEGYPDPELAGTVLDMIVEVRDCVELHLLNPGDPDILQRLGVNENTTSLEEVIQNVGIGWMEQHLQTLNQEANEQMFTELVLKTEFSDLPQQVVESELFERWKKGEARLLQQFGASEAELAQSWAAWSANEDLWQEASRNVALTLIMRAFAEERGLEPTQDDGIVAFQGLADDMGMTGKDFAEALEERPEIGAHAIHVGFMKRLRDLIVAEVPRNDPNAHLYEPA